MGIDDYEYFTESVGEQLILILGSVVATLAGVGLLLLMAM